MASTTVATAATSIELGTQPPTESTTPSESSESQASTDSSEPASSEPVSSEPASSEPASGEPGVIDIAATMLCVDERVVGTGWRHRVGDSVITATLVDGSVWTSADAGATPSGLASATRSRTRSVAVAQPAVVLPPSWTRTSATTATFVVVLAALPDCPDAETAPGGDSDAALPGTGGNGIGASVAAAALLAASGAALVLAGRRRVS